MRLTFFGTYNTATTQRVQVMIDGLRAHGLLVDECNAPLMLDTAARVKILRQPWRLPILGLHILRCWLKLIVLSRRMPRAKSVVIGYLGHFDIHLARILFPGRQLILDYMISGSDTAKDRRSSGSIKHKLLTFIDNAALRAADLVVLDTEEQLAMLPEKHRSKGVVVSVGAPSWWFAPQKSVQAKVPKPKKHGLSVLFYGAYTPLQGAATIGKAIGSLKTPVDVTMIGDGQDFEETKLEASKSKTANVTWIKWVDNTELPKLVADHDVCLGIFGEGPKSYRVVPNKVYQGAAGGAVIVTSDTPPQRRVLGDAALFVPPNDPKALAEALTHLAAHPEEVIKRRAKILQQAQQNFTPQKIVEPLLAKLSK
jgi:glycosyltransferase involved in cell wall biosynthesis